MKEKISSLVQITDSFFGLVLIAAVRLSNGYYLGALLFLQFKEFELYWGAVFLGLEDEHLRSFFKSILLE